MLPVIDRSIIVFFSGIVLSFLEMKGIASPSHHSDNLQTVQTVVGGFIAVVTIISFYKHHTATFTGAVDTKPSFSLSSFLIRIKQFILTRQVTQIPPQTQEAEPQGQQ